MPKRLTETIPLSEAGTSTTTSGRMKIHAITAGLGSSGYYSPEVLREAATNELITTGTHLYLDHPSETDRVDRPERSVRDIAAFFTGPATYDESAQALVGEVQVFSPYRDLLTEMAPHIGLSISGSATDIIEGQVNGRTVSVVEGLARIDSVDFVTRAGRGGKVLSVLESARFIREATADDRAEQLSDAVQAAHAADGVHVWVVDQDAERSVVWFRVYTDGQPSRTYEQTYAIAANDAAVTLSGDPTEVSRMTNYVPVTRSDSTNPTTEETTEVTMGKIQVEESVHTDALAKAGRVDALTNENAALKTEVASLKEAGSARDRVERAREIISARAQEAGIAFTPLETRGLLADLPLKEGALDEDAFTTTVDEAAKAPAAGTTTTRSTGVTGFGASATPTAQESAPARPTTNPWGRPLTESKGA